MHRLRMAFLVGAALCWAGVAMAQGQAPPSPCAAEDSSYRDFDFWLGEWEVFAAANDQKAGENSITRAEGDCVLIERWTGSKGSTGQSYNFYDPNSEKWTQVWVSSGSIIRIHGGFEEGAMRLVGEIVYHANGQTAPFKGTWTPQEDGSVRQHFEQFDAESDSWKPWFTGIYRKKTG